MGKASRRQNRKQQPGAVNPVLPASPSTALVVGAGAAIVALAGIPYGPFHVVPQVERLPLAVLLATGMIFGLPGFRDRLPARLRPAAIAEGAGLFIILSSWFLLKVIGLHPSGTDDNIYFYLANRVAQGAVPYRDFFFSHPPVHLLVPAAVFKVFGYSIGAAKLIPVMAQTAAGAFMYLTLRKASPRLALIGLFAHFSTYQILMGSTDMNGENIMTMFLWAAMWAVTNGWGIAGGILAGLAIGSGMYALAAVMAIGLAAFLAGRRRGFRFLAGCAGVFVLMLAVFGALGGKSFFDGVFTYHTRKHVGAEGRESIFATGNPFVMIRTLLSNLAAFLTGDTFKKTLYYHGAMFLLAVPATVLALLPLKVKPRRFDPAQAHWPALISLVATVLFLLQWAAVNEVYDFYLVPMLSFMCPAVAYAVDTAIERLSRANGPRGLLVPAAVAGAAWLAIPAAIALNGNLWPEEKANAGEVVRYEWREPSILRGPAALSKVLFFADHRERGAVTPYYRHYMWNKLLTFSTVDDIAAWVKANTPADSTITGASTLAPLVALHAGRRMAGDEADTNGKRFSSGMLTDRKFMDRICADRVDVLISASNSYFPAKKMATDPTFSQAFQQAAAFEDRQLKHFGGFQIGVFRVREGNSCGRKPGP